ncbi:hypothetical protein Tco_1469295, partial [Tanacetum coccineum]
PSILLPIPKIPSVAPAITLLPPPPSLPYHIERCQELKEVDHTITLRASLRSKILSAVNAYLRSSMGDALQNVLQKHTEELEQYTVKKVLEKTPLLLAQSSSQAQSSLKAAESLSEYKLKTILFKKIDKRRSCLTHDKHQALFDALDRDDEDPSARPNQGKKSSRSRIKESEPSKKSSTTKESSKGKSPAKTSKYGKSVTTKDPVEEPVFETASDDIEQTVDDVVNDVDQPPDDTT